MKELLTALLVSASVCGAVEFVGHRGEPTLAPQNSLESLNLCWKSGKYAESDFHEIKSGELIAIHGAKDYKLFSGADVKIAELTMDDVRKVNLAGIEPWNKKYAFLSIPTLDDVLAALPKGKVLVFEVKNYSPTYAEKIENARVRHGVKKEQIVFISFSKNHLKDLKMKLDGYKTYLLTSVKKMPNPQDAIAICKSIGADGLDIGSANLLTKEYVDAIKSAGLGIWVWTVNDFNAAMRLRDMGVEYITTDHASEFRNKMSQK